MNIAIRTTLKDKMLDYLHVDQDFNFMVNHGITSVQLVGGYKFILILLFIS